MSGGTEPRAEWHKADAAERRARRTVAAIVLTLVVVTGAYRVLVLNRVQHTSLVFVGLPALAALLLLYTRPQTAIGTINKVIAILLCLSGILFGEGLVCILFAAPIFFLVGTIVGYIVNKVTGRRPPDDPTSHRWRGAVSLALVPLSIEGVVPGFELGREEQVTVTQVVAADPDAVRATLARPPRFERQLPAFLRLGFPVPSQTGGAGLDVGDERVVVFAHGRHHDGALVMRVAESRPRSIVFIAAADSSYITHWLQWERATVEWEPVAAGRVRVSWTLAYRRRLDPAWYFGPLERFGVRKAAGYLIETLAMPELVQSNDRR